MSYFCDNILLLYGNGEWEAGKTHDIITTDNLSQVYDCPFHAIKDNAHSMFVPYQENE